MDEYFRYDKLTGRLIGKFNPQIDPLESKNQGKPVYMYPPNLIELDELPEIDKEKEIFYVEDGKLVKYKKLKVYDKETKEEIDIDEKHFDSVQYTEKEPPIESYYEWDGQDWTINEELKIKYDDRREYIDKKKALLISLVEYQDEFSITLIDKIKELEVKVQELEKKLDLQISKL